MKVQILILTLLLSLQLAGQDFPAPDFRKKEDYKAHELEVLRAIDWLFTNPVDHPNRKEANAYVLAWASGTPYVTVMVNGYVNGLSDKNPDVLLLYMGAWIKYVISTGDKDETEINFNVVKAITDYYRAGNGMQKDKDLDDLVKLDQKGKLRDWVKRQLDEQNSK